jgi:hypothetical protein
MGENVIEDLYTFVKFGMIEFKQQTCGKFLPYIDLS